MDMSKFNKGDIFALDAYDAGGISLAIGPKQIKFRFELGEMHYLRYDELRCLYTNQNNYVIVDLTLYDIHNLRICFNSNDILNTTVTDFDGKDGELHIRMIDHNLMDLKVCYGAYKWEYVREYASLSNEEREKLSQDMIDGFEDSDCQ